jgi:Flp pilus assembly protein TadD
MTANVAGDARARAAALENLTRLTPANARNLRELASLEFAQRNFPEAVRAYQGVARVVPDDPTVWNELGYAQAFSLDLASARNSIDRYRQIAPDDPNALDSLGEINFFLGDFAAAERAFLDGSKQSQAPAGTPIIKAAQARLMTGDVAGADALFVQYMDLARPPQRPVANYQHAQWDFLTGRRKAALAQIGQVIPTLSGDPQTLALCQLALWKLQTGDADGASAIVDRAAAAARTPEAGTLANTLRTIVSAQPSASATRLANAVALLFARKYADALPLLNAEFQAASPGSDGEIRTLLAWAYVELGRFDQAGKLINTYPLPLNSGDPLFASLIFPRFLYLRGVVLEKEGKRAEAKQSYQLYQKFAGDIPGAFGEEAKVKDSLNRL